MSQSGLTLIEMLVTLIILSMAGVVAAEAVRLGRRSWDRQQTEADAEQRIRVVYGILAQELASMQPVFEVVEGTRVIMFEGWADRVLFCARPDIYQPFPYNSMVRKVSFSVDRDQGLIMSETYPLVTEESSRSRVKIIDSKISRIAFRYLSPPAGKLDDSNWVERWIPLELARAVAEGKQKAAEGQTRGEVRGANHDSGLPAAIEVNVTIAQQGREEKFSFLVPIQVGSYL